MPTHCSISILSHSSHLHSGLPIIYSCDLVTLHFTIIVIAAAAVVLSNNATNAV